MLKGHIRTQFKTRGLILRILIENVAILIKGKIIVFNEWKWREKISKIAVTGR
ncbi:hypothetical protein AAJ76_8500011095 [Vairimorpha ceranae]|uniref:Uncharacterized protein n=1 Tax=Vairimorpha ceranae TaxID=40302 RepID=A0A0F9WMM1_9MICR|nr:hypothetical protein AAJ76_8500011095 [Vairimorpha ceranae]KKO74308.1 hypothetical protein AAJ76_8500011095 [Vairimorpha ceranae]